jgi:hypothetical protein
MKSSDSTDLVAVANGIGDLRRVQQEIESIPKIARNKYRIKFE